MENTQLPTQTELDSIYQEMNEEFMERMIDDIRHKTIRTANELAHRYYGQSLWHLSHTYQKRLVTEAAQIVTNQIIEESQGRIY